jgi:hypothetical protein
MEEMMKMMLELTAGINASMQSQSQSMQAMKNQMLSGIKIKKEYSIVKIPRC